jgi:Methyltransferase domain
MSWYEREPRVSLRLIERFAPARSLPVIDVGAGTSSLVDHLVRRGVADITVLDVSEGALAQVKKRLGTQSVRVRFVHDDVLSWRADRQYGVWHDRAVFHFLTSTHDRDRYVTITGDAVCRGGIVVLGTFASDGPPSCSGLPVARYGWQDLCDLFAASFSLVHHERQEHGTPSGVIQPFTWVVLRRGEHHAE